MIICDIDGTISTGYYLLNEDCSKCADFTNPDCWRNPFKDNCDWLRMKCESYTDEALIAADEPRPLSKEVLTKLSDSGHEIVYITERPLRLEHATIAWLSENGFPPQSKGKKKYKVMMRDDDDDRPGVLLKQFLIGKIVSELQASESDGGKLVAFDDNAKMGEVCDAFGITFYKAPECWAEIAKVIDLVQFGRASQ